MKCILPWMTGLCLLGGCADLENREYGRRPEWSLPGPAGARVCASDFQNKVVVVDFWATWCPPCRREIPGWIELQEKYREKGLVILGLSFDRDKEVHDRWIRENHLNYLSIFVQTDEGRSEVAKFEKLVGQTVRFPTTLIINRQGTIVHKRVGYASMEEFDRILQALL